MFPLAKTLPVVDSDLDFRLSIQGRPDDNDDEQYEPTDDEGGDDIPPPDDPPPPGRISTDDLERMIDERHEADQSFHHHGADSMEAHPPTEMKEPIRGESVAIPDSDVDAKDQGGEGPSSSKPKPKSPEDTRRNPKFDVFVDYELDSNVMPNGKPTPKGFVWDGVRLVRKKANSKRVPGYPSDLWVRLDPVTRNIEWERYQKWLKDKEEQEDKEKDKDKDKSSPAVNPSFSAPAMPVVEDVYEPHRSPLRELIEDKIAELQEGLNFELFAAVARVLTKAEIGQSKDTQKALDVEWQKLIDKGVWDEHRVKECKR